MPETKISSAEIISVGTELLLGDITNTDASYLARHLALLGIPLYRQTVVGDNAERLKGALRDAYSRSSLVILTGGLGPTCDDITKEVTAEFFGLSLVTHTETRERIINYFKTTGKQFTENNLKQSLVPEGCTVFTNSWGTAPGIGIEKDGRCAVLLPGPPYELKLVFEEAVMPWIKRFSPKTFYSVNLHLAGIGESAAENILRHMMDEGKNPTIAPYVGEGDVRIRVTAGADSTETAREMCLDTVEKIRKTEAGEHIYALTESPEDAEAVAEKTLLSRFGEKELTFAAAESCTGGMVNTRLTAIPGSSSVVLGGVVSYSNSVKERVLGVPAGILEKYGAVSENTAEKMAEGVRKLTGADIAVSVTGIAGPDGGSEEKPVGTVCFAVASRLGTQTSTEHYRIGLSRERIRRLASTNAIRMAYGEAEKL